jgi:hypothetical protein
VQQFLRTQRRQALQRDARIATTIERIDAALQAAGVGAVGLKGRGAATARLYRAGERPMGDIDLLVPRRTAPRGASPAQPRLRRGLRYAAPPVFSAAETARLTRAGEHPDNPLKIEVHESVGESLPVRRVDITGTCASRLASGGCMPIATRPNCCATCCCTRASNMRAHALRQVQLHDIALLAPRLGPGAWDKLLDSRGTGRLLVDVSAPGSLPCATTRVAPPCRSRLRARLPARVADGRAARNADRRVVVEPAHPRISGHLLVALTARGAALCAAEIPARQTASRNYDVKVDAQPALYQVPWYGLGPRQRILRWVCLAPAAGADPRLAAWRHR